MQIHNRSKFQQAVNQVRAEKMLEGETLGARWFSAIDKAVTEIDENSSIAFNGGFLSFKSSTSGKRYVLGAGGHIGNNCEAAEAGQPCRHLAVYLILKRYTDTINSEVVAMDNAIKVSIAPRAEKVSGFRL